MLSHNRIRVLGALVFSLVAHGMLIGLDLRREEMPAAGMVQQKVRMQLVARPAPAVPPVVAPARLPRQTEPATAVAPVLARPVEVAVREIPAVSLPVAPIVPEPAAPAKEILPAEPEQVAATNEAARSAIIMARPRYRDNQPPEYPARARRRNQQGVVVLEVAVTRDGRVAKLKIRESSGHEILDRAAVRAVKDWLFEPGQRGGLRVAMPVLVPVRFSLR